MERQLAAILYADVAGYSRLAGIDVREGQAGRDGVAERPVVLRKRVGDDATPQTML